VAIWFCRSARSAAPRLLSVSAWIGVRNVVAAFRIRSWRPRMSCVHSAGGRKSSVSPILMVTISVLSNACKQVALVLTQSVVAHIVLDEAKQALGFVVAHRAGRPAEMKVKAASAREKQLRIPK
jgi:hypothetical protein